MIAAILLTIIAIGWHIVEVHSGPFAKDKNALYFVKDATRDTHYEVNTQIMQLTESGREYVRVEGNMYRFVGKKATKKKGAFAKTPRFRKVRILEPAGKAWKVDEFETGHLTRQELVNAMNTAWGQGKKVRWFVQKEFRGHTRKFRDDRKETYDFQMRERPFYKRQQENVYEMVYDDGFQRQVVYYQSNPDIKPIKEIAGFQPLIRIYALDMDSVFKWHPHWKDEGVPSPAWCLSAYYVHGEGKGFERMDEGGSCEEETTMERMVNNLNRDYRNHMGCNFGNKLFSLAKTIDGIPSAESGAAAPGAHATQQNEYGYQDNHGMYDENYNEEVLQYEDIDDMANADESYDNMMADYNYDFAVEQAREERELRKLKRERKRAQNRKKHKLNEYRY